MKHLVRIEKTSAGPALYIGTVLVRTWLGTVHDGEAERLADQLREELNRPPTG
jgi:hypothetical protein